MKNDTENQTGKIENDRRQIERRINERRKMNVPVLHDKRLNKERRKNNDRRRKEEKKVVIPM